MKKKYSASDWVFVVLGLVAIPAVLLLLAQSALSFARHNGFPGVVRAVLALAFLVAMMVAGSIANLEARGWKRRFYELLTLVFVVGCLASWWKWL